MAMFSEYNNQTIFCDPTQKSSELILTRNEQNNIIVSMIPEAEIDARLHPDVSIPVDDAVKLLDSYVDLFKAASEYLKKSQQKQ